MPEQATRVQQAQDAVKAAQERLKKAKAAQQLAEARKRAAATKVERAKDTRRKVLLGAFVMEFFAARKADPARFLFSGENGRRFEDWLKKEADRALFGLPPLAEPKAAPKPEAQS